MLGHVVGIFFVVVFLVNPCLASSFEESASGVSSQETTSTKTDVEAYSSKKGRGNTSYYLGANYSYFDLILPAKFGASVAYQKDANKVYELDYLYSSMKVPFIIKDLGKLAETRISLIQRNYFDTNSFNAYIGIFHNEVKLTVGNALLARIPNTNYPNIVVLEIETVGVSLGVANRWQYENGIALSIEWFGWAQPLLVTKKDTAFIDAVSDSDDKKNIDKAVGVISYFPRLSFCKLQLGYAF
jgi:hypothetical protein